jgi:hypothetical protein
MSENPCLIYAKKKGMKFFSLVASYPAHPLKAGNGENDWVGFDCLNTLNDYVDIPTTQGYSGHQ